MLRLLLLLAVLSAPASRAQSTRGPADAVGGGLVPTDTTRWTRVPSGSDVRVYLDGEVAWPVEGVVEVWTWRSHAAPHRPRFGTAYDRVLARDRVFCLLGTTAPLRVVRYLGSASVGSFMFPSSVGPFGWGPGSVEEAVAQTVCEIEADGVE